MGEGMSGDNDSSPERRSGPRPRCPGQWRRGRPVGRSASRRDAPERPDVAPRVHRLSTRLLRAHVRGSAQDHAQASHGRTRDGLQSVAGAGLERRIERFRQPEVQNLYGAVGAHLMLAGFRSRWTISRSCAASALRRPASRSRGPVDGRALRDASRPASAPRPAPARAPGALGLLEPVNRRDVRVVQRGEDLRFALEARQAIGINREIRAGP